MKNRASILKPHQAGVLLMIILISFCLSINAAKFAPSIPASPHPAPPVEKEPPVSPPINNEDPPFGIDDPIDWNWRLGVGSVLIFIGGTLSGSVGVGGGGVYVPVLVLLCGFSPKEAIPISKVCILGVAISSFIVNVRRRHPKADRPLIDFNMALLLSPSTLLGTVVGVTLYVVFPQWLVLVLLVVVLGITDYRTFAKAIELWKKEKAEDLAAKANTQDADGPEETKGLLAEHKNVSGVESNVDVEKSEANSADAEEFKKSMTRTPVWKIFLLVILWMGMFGLVFTRGGGEGQDVSYVGILKCSLDFWLIGVAVIVWLLGGGILYLIVVVHRWHLNRIKFGIPYIDGDVAWTKLKYLAFMTAGFVGGTCAGFLGIGSGMINGPFMLEMQVQPEVAAATSIFIITFTALSTVAQYFIINSLAYKYAAWYGSIGIVAAVLGQFGVAYIVKKYKKSSIISFLLAIIIGVSMIAMTVMGVIRIVDKAKSGGTFGFGDYCELKHQIHPPHAPIAPSPPVHNTTTPTHIPAPTHVPTPTATPKAFW